MRTNRKKPPIRTHEGAVAQRIKPELQLRRSVMACLLWEDTFYESGIEIAQRIASLVDKVDSGIVASLAVEAREKMHLRHVPLLLAVLLARKGELKAITLETVIQRPDELTEFLSLYWEGSKCPLSKQVKLGLAGAFTKFGAYQLAKYNRDTAIKLRDVLFLCHAKPKDQNQAAVWKKLIDGTLEPPDTWEVALSGGEDKKSAWTRLLTEEKLGGFALIRNLRNMIKANVDEKLVKDSIENIQATNILPFRFIVAAKYAPQFEPNIEKALLKCLNQQPKLGGKTIFIVDVSGSMYGGRISKYSELDRFQVACGLAILIREMCEDARIYATAGDDGRRIHATKLVPPRHGFALSDAVHRMCDPLGGGGIFLKQVMDYVYEKEKSADRIIVITDEQDCDIKKGGSPLSANVFGKHNYMLNVSINKNGIGYGKWIHIDGFSEAVLDYIREYESSF